MRSVEHLEQRLFLSVLFFTSAITNDHKSSGLKQHRIIILRSAGQKSDTWVTWRHLHGCIAFCKLEGGLCASLSFPVTRGPHIPWLIAPFLPSPEQQHCISLTIVSWSRLPSSKAQTVNLMLRTCVVRPGPPGSSRLFLHRKVLLRSHLQTPFCHFGGILLGY